MNISVSADYESMSRQAAEHIIRFVHKKPDALLCLAGGNTPVLTYRYLEEAVAMGKVSFDRCRFVGLDEWIGLGREDEGSCQRLLYSALFEPIGIRQEQIIFFDAKADDLQAECKRVDELIRAQGAIDLMLLGLGVNCHLGFNEPGVRFDQYTHVTLLADVTKQVGQKYFLQKTELSRGITLGIRHVMETGTVLLIVNGENKAAAVRQLLKGSVTPDCPASILQNHPDCHVFLDKGAASEHQRL